MRSKAIVFLLIPSLVGVLWLIKQENAISTLQQENERLRVQIAENRGARSQRVMAGNPNAVTDSPRKSLSEWKSFAHNLAKDELRHFPLDLERGLEASARIASMSRRQVEEFLAQIAEMDISNQERTALEKFIFDSLIEEMPDLMLQHFGGRIHDSRWSIGLLSCFRHWSKQDTEKAKAWFEEELARGTFERSKRFSVPNSFHYLRDQFEASLITALNRRDIDAASERLRVLSGDNWNRVMTFLVEQGSEPEDQRATHELIRRHTQDLGSKNSGYMWLMVNHLKENGRVSLKAVEEYLERVGATPDERGTTTQYAAMEWFSSEARQRKIGYEDVKTISEWSKRHSTRSSAHVVGQALQRYAELNPSKNWEAAADLATRYHDEGGGDLVLYPFVDGVLPKGHEDKIRDMIGRIDDPKLQQKLKEQLK